VEPTFLAVSRFAVPEEEAAGFAPRAHKALAALAGRPGHVAGRLGRAVDDPERWVMVTEWDGVGAYRRALGAFEVRTALIPLYAHSVDGSDPEAYAVVSAADPGTDRATDAASAGPRRDLGGTRHPRDRP
jgi:heme oxygenase (mycobilin-producing)